MRASHACVSQLLNSLSRVQQRAGLDVGWYNQHISPYHKDHIENNTPRIAGWRCGTCI